MINRELVEKGFAAWIEQMSSRSSREKDRAADDGAREREIDRQMNRTIICLDLFCYAKLIYVHIKYTHTHAGKHKTQKLLMAEKLWDQMIAQKRKGEPELENR